MTHRLWRLRKKLLVGAAALPLMQTTGCPDLTSILISTGTNFAQTLTGSLTQNFIGGLQTFLIQTFPSANLLRILFGLGGIFTGS